MKKESIIVKNGVILNLIQDFQRWLWSLLNCLRGKCQIKFGMTSLFNEHAFTLIELLVVVLIIGILATAALPQYQLAVEKSRAMQALTAVKMLSEHLEQYYMENGNYPYSFTITQLNEVLPVSITLPTNFEIHGNPSAYIGMRKNSRNSYMIAYTLQSGWVSKGKFVCSTDFKEDNNTLSSQVCKNLCRKSTLVRVWGSGEFGCYW